MLKKYLLQNINKQFNKIFSVKLFSTVPQTKDSGVIRTYGGLKDQDRIFTNVYRDGDPFIEGALKRVFLFFI